MKASFVELVGITSEVPMLNISYVYYAIDIVLNSYCFGNKNENLFHYFSANVFNNLKYFCSKDA